jgi:hypothetical protein
MYHGNGYLGCDSLRYSTVKFDMWLLSFRR